MMAASILVDLGVGTVNSLYPVSGGVSDLGVDLGDRGRRRFEP